MVHNVVRRGAALRRLSLLLLRKNGQLLASFMHSLNWLHLRLLFWCILHSLGLLATLIEVVFEVGVHEYAVVGASAERRVLRNFARVLAADLVGRVEPNLLLRYFAQILAVEMPLLFLRGSRASLRGCLLFAPLFANFTSELGLGCYCGVKREVVAISTVLEQMVSLLFPY